MNDIEVCDECGEEFHDGASQGYALCPDCGCTELEDDDVTKDMCYLIRDHGGPHQFTPAPVDLTEDDYDYLYKSLGVAR